MTNKPCLVGAGLVLALGVLLVASESFALEPAATLETTQWTGGLRLGSDDLDFGIGARGGYTLDNALYLGGTFDYFFGDDHEQTYLGVRSEVDYDLMVFTFEGGYDLGITHSLVVRPFGGLGMVRADTEVCQDDLCLDDSESDFVFTLGGLLYYVAGSFIVGPELRILVWDTNAFVLGGNIGGAF